MDESTEPQTPEEEVAWRDLEAKQRRRHRWIALLLSVNISAHTMAILAAAWHGWPPNARDLGPLAFLVVNALVSLGLSVRGLRELREDEAMDRRWKLQDVRWQAQGRAWRERWADGLSADRLYGFGHFIVQTSGIRSLSLTPS